MKNRSILSLLENKKFILSDGAMGTELLKRGVTAIGGCPEELNITAPDRIREIHHDYYSAGSEFVTTNTFGANSIRLSRSGNSLRVAEFCHAAIRIAKEAAPEGRFVAGSMGPTGELVEPYGELTIDYAYKAFAEQSIMMETGGADFILIETMMAIEEAETAVRAAKESAALPVFATMTFEKSDAGMRTMWGVDTETAVTRLGAAGADAVGANCGRGFEEMVEIIREMKNYTQLPLIAQSNAGLPEIIDGVSHYKETPASVEQYIDQLLSLGVRIIGGCCGTGPEHIRFIRTMIDRRG